MRVKIFLSVLSIVALISLYAAQPAFSKQDSDKSGLSRNPTYWPPRVNHYYPDMELLDCYGRKVRLSSFRGKILIVEPIGMSCPACQAFAGANRSGVRPYANVRPQSGLSSFEEMLKKYGGTTINDPRIIYVQLLLYNMRMTAPSVKEAKAWAKNFGFLGKRNQFVLIGRKSMVSKYSYNLIPGFQLIDRNYVLRCDSTGHRPGQNLYKDFFPMLKKLL